MSVHYTGYRASSFEKTNTYKEVSKLSIITFKKFGESLMGKLTQFSQNLKISIDLIIENLKFCVYLLHISLLQNFKLATN